jgi:hypothetical protein
LRSIPVATTTSARNSHLSFGNGTLAFDGFARNYVGSILHYFLYGLFTVESDKAKSTRAVGGMVHHDDGILNMAKIFEVSAEIIGVCFGS